MNALEKAVVAMLAAAAAGQLIVVHSAAGTLIFGASDALFAGIVQSAAPAQTGQTAISGITATVAKAA